MKVVFANVLQGFVYAHDGSKSAEMKFMRFSLPEYAEFFRKRNPDVLCLAEALVDELPERSEMLSQISGVCKLPYVKVMAKEKSWLYRGRFYGQAMLSHYPIDTYETSVLLNPKFEITHSNGEHWVMQDKFMQRALINTPQGSVNIFNLHYFPAHHFGKELGCEEMRASREALVREILRYDLETPTVVTGDFNNKGSRLTMAFPELFTENKLAESLEVETTISNGKDQLDHILYNPQMLRVINARVEKYLSDHYALIAELSL